MNKFRIKQAVILAGGQGKRLLPFTLNNPKPMILLNGKPFLDHLIILLKENKVKNIVILTGYLREKIEKYFGDGSKFGVKIRYSYTPFLNENSEENKSGIRLKNAKDLLDDYFLLMYCDNYWPLELSKLSNFYLEKKAGVLITVYSNKDNSSKNEQSSFSLPPSKNNIFVDKLGFVTEYDSSRMQKNLNGVEIGFFIINKNIFKLLPDGNSKFEDIVLPILIKKRKLAGFLTDQKYYSISDLKRAKITEKFLSDKKVIFLDRDGVINQKPKKADYVKNWKEFIFSPGAIEAIKLLKEKGYKVIIISNQAGIGRGIMTKKDLEVIHKKMQAEFKKIGAKIDGIYYCPHGWDEGCWCRKPKPGLLIQASRDHLIDLTKTIFIGDDVRDKQTGKAAGIKTILVTKRNNLLKIVQNIV